LIGWIVYFQKIRKYLSAPVVLIQEGVAVLPLVGKIDSYKASYILERGVPKIAEL
jgi:rsbT co-antagonist protein RsbR